MDRFARYAQQYGELLQTMVDWTFVSPTRNFLRSDPQTLVTGGTDECAFHLGWEPLDKLLVMSITNPQQPDQVYRFVCPGGSGGLFTFFANATLYADQRRAKHELTFILNAVQLERFRDMVYEYNEPDDIEEEPISTQTAAFYDEHPDLAPDWWNQGPACTIVEERAIEELTHVRLWVRDATVAMHIGLWWERRKDGQQKVEGSPDNA